MIEFSVEVPADVKKTGFSLASTDPAGKFPDRPGSLRVRKVEMDSWADENNIKEGNEITKLQNIPIQGYPSSAEVEAALAQRPLKIELLGEPDSDVSSKGSRKQKLPMSPEAKEKKRQARKKRRRNVVILSNPHESRRSCYYYRVIFLS